MISTKIRSLTLAWFGESDLISRFIGAHNVIEYVVDESLTLHFAPSRGLSREEESVDCQINLTTGEVTDHALTCSEVFTITVEQLSTWQ